MYYYANIYLGSKLQQLKVAFSTAATTSVINAKDCQGCTTAGFDFVQSFSIHKVLAKHISYHIGGYIAQGVLVQDDLKLDTKSNFSLKQFPFLLVNEWQQSPFEKVDGVIGLSRQYLTVDGNNSGSQLVDTLYESGQIERKIFSIHYGPEGSEIQFGGYDSSKILAGSSLKFLKTPYAKEWQVSVSAIKLGEGPTFPNGAKRAYYFDSKPAYLDSFSPYIQVPRSGGIQLYSLILHEIQYEVVDGLLMGPCDKSLYDTVSLYVNDKYYITLTPDSFVLDIGQGDKCFLPFRYNNEDHWVLGEPFFRNYYSVYDVQKGIIGVAPSANSPNASITEGEVPGDKLPDLHDPRQDSAAARKKLPNPQDPLGVLSFVFGRGSHGKGSSTNGKDGLWTSIATAVSFLVLVCSCCCLCAGGCAYISYQGNRYAEQGPGL